MTAPPAPPSASPTTTGQRRRHRQLQQRRLRRQERGQQQDGQRQRHLASRGADAGNYHWPRPTPAPPPASPRPADRQRRRPDKVYDAAPAPPSASPTTAWAAMTSPTATAAPPSPTRTWAATRRSASAGSSISGTDAGNYQLASTNASTTASITPRTLTVSATGQDKVYDGTTSATVSLSDNHLGSDDVTDSYSSATFADKNVGSNKTVSVSGIASAAPMPATTRWPTPPPAPRPASPRAADRQRHRPGQGLRRHHGGHRHPLRQPPRQR